MVEKNSVQEDMQSFDRLRSQLLSVSSQKQQIDFQLGIIREASKELADSKEEKVFKAVGNIMVQVEKAKAAKDLKDNEEELGIRLESMKKQESSLIDRLNKLKTKIEESQKTGKEKESS